MIETFLNLEMTEVCGKKVKYRSKEKISNIILKTQYSD